MLEVIKPGLETSVQDLPGRIGYWEQGFPFSGPMDFWSFQLANLLVGNAPGAAGLECQFTGPILRIQRDAVVAVTGADMAPLLDGEPAPMWRSFAVRAGQTLGLGFARIARGPIWPLPAVSTRRRYWTRAPHSTKRESAAWKGTR